MLFIDEHIPALDQAYPFSIVGTPGYMIQGSAEACFEKEESVLCGSDMAIKGWREW